MYERFTNVIEQMRKQQEAEAVGGYKMPFVSPYDDEYASKTYAGLIRGQYADYQERFRPYEQQLLNYANGVDLLDQQLSRITANVNNAYDNPSMSAGSLAQERYGIKKTGSERRASQRNMSLQQAASTAHARNNTRLANQDQKMNIVTGGTSVRGLAANEAMGG